jgi:hypothetical protein
MAKLNSILERFRGAFIDDRRKSANGGRLWVEDPHQRVELGSELKALGFKWANSCLAWYFPEA